MATIMQTTTLMQYQQIFERPENRLRREDIRKMTYEKAESLIEKYRGRQATE